MATEPNFLSTLASTVRDGITDADINDACRAAADALGDGVDGVGVALSLPGTMRAVIGGNNHIARELEQAQLTAAEGPCTLATWTGHLVATPDLQDPAETRWPILVRNLADLPVRAVTAVPLALTAAAGGGGAVGSLDVHSIRPHGLDHLDPADLAALAAILTVAVLNMTAPNPNTAAIATMVWAEIQQATGMVTHTLGIPALDALDRLRALAFTQGRWLSDIAHDVVSGRQPADLTHPAT